MVCVLGDVKKWFADKGDQTHRLDYLLTNNSIVFDLGAYEGVWSQKIIERYRSQVYAFEPVKTFFNQTKTLLAKYPSATVFQYGLGPTTENLNIYLSEDGTSLYKQNGSAEVVLIKEMLPELQRLSITKIDLIKINIEGAEYPLLEYILRNNIHLMLTNIQVQFHILDDSSAGKRESIRQKLSQTHVVTYDYPFVWENWRKK